jgi:hypothetical protein
MIPPGVNKIMMEALAKKVGPTVACPRCGASEQPVYGTDGFVKFPIQPAFGGGFQIGGPTYQALALSCLSCGDMWFINPKTLGVEDKILEFMRSEGILGEALGKPGS